MEVMAMDALVVLDGLTKRFGSFTAVDGISLTVDKGEVVGFLGPNGAGKSTTMKMAAGFLEPDAGTAVIAGYDVMAAPRSAKMRTGYMPEGAPAYGEMTPMAFLQFVAEVRGLDGAARRSAIDDTVTRTGLEGVVHQTIETLSKGFKRRVGLAQAILHDPEVLILDEPTDGLDPNQKHHVRSLISGMAKEKAIIVSTHILEEVDAVCSRAIIIDRGRIVADGTSRELKHRLPNHNAVTIRLATGDADKAKAALARLEGVAKVETLGRGKHVTRLRALPASRKLIAADVVDALRSAKIATDELFVEQGNLDDVFRQITTSDTGGAHA
jgi:ABC-2 type transport system ATP-binding protein